MYKVRKVLLVAFLVIFVFGSIALAGGSNNGKDPVTIRLATAFAPGHILADSSVAFKTLIEEATNGRITVQLELGKDTEANVDLRCSRGEVDMQWTGGQPLQDFAPQYFFFNAPYVIKDYDHFLRVWKSHLGKEARELVTQNGNMLCLTTAYRGFRQTTANKPLITPTDFAGLRLRLPPVPDWIAIWQAVGASPVSVPLTGLYDSLKTGVAEASEGDLAQISSFKLYEVQSHLIMTNHLVAIGWCTINQTFYNKLANRDQKLIEELIDQVGWWATLKTKVDEGNLMSQLQAKNMQVIIPDAAAIRDKAKPAVDNLFVTKWPVTTWAEVLSY
ncbi:MAG TPA: TRAP transporter substrate-binding protein [Bacillota bacterium]|nr:TRAP transporter substrate-binding protein [Bacillota bacterium]